MAAIAAIAAPRSKSDPPRPNAPGALRSAPRRAWLLIVGTGAIVLGLLPHILHHAGPLAGAALFAAVFLISTFVVGPQISGGDGSESAPALDRSTAAPAEEEGSAHDSHH